MDKLLNGLKRAIPEDKRMTFLIFCIGIVALLGYRASVVSEKRIESELTKEGNRCLVILGQKIC